GSAARKDGIDRLAERQWSVNASPWGRARAGRLAAGENGRAREQCEERRRSHFRSGWTNRAPPERPSSKVPATCCRTSPIRCDSTIAVWTVGVWLARGV